MLLKKEFKQLIANLVLEGYHRYREASLNSCDYWGRNCTGHPKHILKYEEDRFYCLSCTFHLQRFVANDCEVIR